MGSDDDNGTLAIMVPTVVMSMDIKHHIRHQFSIGGHAIFYKSVSMKKKMTNRNNICQYKNHKSHLQKPYSKDHKNTIDDLLTNKENDIMKWIKTETLVLVIYVHIKVMPTYS